MLNSFPTNSIEEAVFNGVGVAIGPAGENAQALARMFRDFILFHPIISILFFLVGLGWILAFFRPLLKKDDEGISFDPLMFFVILFLSGLITSLGTMVFSTYHIVDDGQMRYWLPFLLAPIFLAPLLFGTFLKNGRVPHVLSTALIGVIFLVQGVVWVDSDHRWMQRYYPTPAACLDDALSSAGVLRGVAPYWEARKYTFLSRLPGMEIAQVSDDLTPNLWINSDHDYGAPFRFAIVSKEGVSLEKSLRNKLGAPVSVRECQAFKVLFWTTPFYVRVQAGE